MASAAIHAGGRASRLDGRDKSALVVGGRSIDASGNRHRLLASVNTPAEYEEIETLADHGR
jgi:GTP:adenosylcobinamide-phosphate guanylyltransferase